MLMAFWLLNDQLRKLIAVGSNTLNYCNCTTVLQKYMRQTFNCFQNIYGKFIAKGFL